MATLNEEAPRLPLPGHPNRSFPLDNLAEILEMRFEQFGELADLKRAVALNEEAPGHPNRSSPLNNLANILRTRFEQLPELTDLNRVAILHEEAPKLHPFGNHLRSTPQMSF